MSTLKVSAIQSPSTTDGGLSISATGAVSGGLPYPNRNLLYNGAMQVAQRGTSATGITGSGYHTADRYLTQMVSAGTWTQTVESDAPDGSGFSKSLKMTCTTADASLSAADKCEILQGLEGQDVQRIAKGTASAQQLTLSFWVKSNVTGTYTVLVYDGDNNRMFSTSYTISASATWEKKSILIPADTTGALDNDNALSLSVFWQLAMGSNFSSGGSLASTWQTLDQTKRAVGQTNLAAAVNNYWQITGVQLETGPVATEFEHRSYGDELARCQRYYQLIANVSGCVAASATQLQASIPLSPVMRATPTVDTTAAIHITDITTSDYDQSSGNIYLNTGTQYGVRVALGNFSGLTAGKVYHIYNSTSRIVVSAEL